ncbi:hypothetical protein UPYG_G00103090 [Umbra pygmaea]|uniref:Uncharacterized protein n=1 Tax=Umbra pygmaea TaxID=75934 RepID=A0ABD0X1F3_UMBPY
METARRSTMAKGAYFKQGHDICFLDVISSKSCEKHGTRDENRLMEEKKKKQEKKPKEAAQKKVTEQNTKVPDSAKPVLTPHPRPTNPSATPSVLPSAGSNGKCPPSGAQPQSQPPPAQQRYSPREVPPRFRQQEYKQLLKRGQPLPSGTLATLPGRPQSESNQNASGASHSGCVVSVLYRPRRLGTLGDVLGQHKANCF